MPGGVGGLMWAMPKSSCDGMGITTSRLAPVPTPRTRACHGPVPGTASRARGPLAPLTLGLAWGPSGPESLAPLALLTGHMHALMRREPFAPVVAHLQRTTRGRAPADKAKCVGYQWRKREHQCNDHWRNRTQTVHKLAEICTNSYEICTNFRDKFVFTHLSTHSFARNSYDFRPICQKSKQTHRNAQGAHLAITRAGD